MFYIFKIKMKYVLTRWVYSIFNGTDERFKFSFYIFGFGYNNLCKLILNNKFSYSLTLFIFWDVGDIEKKTSNYHKALVNMLCKFYKNQVLLNYEYWFLRIASMQNRIKRFYWHKIKFGLIMYTIDKNDKTDEFMRKILTHRH